MPAVIWLSSPGSNSGNSVPGIFGPPGNMPTHSSAPASSPRNQVSPSDASETPGASGFGEPNSTLRSNVASAIAHTASPAATAKAPIGWFLEAPKNVITSAGKGERDRTAHSASDA